MTDKVKLSKMQILFFVFICIMNIQKVITIRGVAFNASLSDVLVPFLMVTLLYHVISRHAKFSDVFYGWQWALALVGWIVLSGFHAIYSPVINDGGVMGLVSELFKTMISLCYFYVGYNALRWLSEKDVFKSWVVGLAVFLGMGFLYMFSANVMYIDIPEIFYIEELVNYKWYFFGTYTDPNHAATYLVISTIVFLFTMKTINEKIWKKIFLVGCLMSTSLFVFFTDSRGGLITLGFVFMYFLVRVLIKNRQMVWFVPLVLWAMLLLAFNIDAHLTGNLYISRLIDSFINFSDGLSVRSGLAKSAFMMGMDYPILGVGRGNFVLNSSMYFKQMGVPFIDNIPHNTFAGIFAELGFLGLLVYLFVVFLIIKKVIQHKQWHSSFVGWFIVPVMMVFFIQGNVLNIENQRVLWVILGYMLYKVIHFTDNKSEGFSKPLIAKKHIKKSKIALMIIISTLVLMIVTGLSYSNLYYVDRSMDIVDGTIEYTLPVSNKYLNQEMTFTYKLYIRQKDFSETGVMMSIIEVLANGQKKVIKEETFGPVNGSFQTGFSIHELDSQVLVRFDNISNNLENYRVLPLTLSVDNYEYNLQRTYLLQALGIDVTWFYKAEKESENLINQPLDISFEDEMVLNQVQLKSISGEYYYILNFTALRDIDIDYKLWLRMTPKNGHILDEKSIKNGYEYYQLNDTITSLEWVKNQNYDVTFGPIDVDEEVLLTLGIYHKLEEKNVYLINDYSRSTSLDLGWSDKRISR